MDQVIMSDGTIGTLAVMLCALSVGIGYLFGSFPTGVILSRVMGLGDLRQVGSGNIGATNVLRTGNKLAAAGTLIGDALKGMLAVWLVGHWFGDVPASFAALGAFVGHCYPVWLRFKGGKGVATFLGVLLALNWPVGLACCAVWALTAWRMRFSSLAALVAAGVAPFFTITSDHPAQTMLAGFLAVLLYWRHRENVIRLGAGTEPRIGAK